MRKLMRRLSKSFLREKNRRFYRIEAKFCGFYFFVNLVCKNKKILNSRKIVLLLGILWYTTFDKIID